MKKIWKIILICVLIILFVGAYFYFKSEKENTNLSISNPASVYCIEHDGKLEIRENSLGQYGVCIFKDGHECEEWAYFRNECK